MRTKEVKLLEVESYISPDIKVVNIKTEQNILAGGSGDGTLHNMPAEPW